MVGAACGGGGSSNNNNNSQGGTAKKGGIFRMASEDFGWTDAFDPTGEYLTTGFLLWSQMLGRKLLTYNHVEGAAGNVLVPDAATEVPTPTDGGKTYTFHLKSGIKFAPPVDREVTSHDFEYAFERIATESLAAQYGFYYFGTIEGMESHKG